MKRQKFVHVCLVIFEWWTTASFSSPFYRNFIFTTQCWFIERSLSTMGKLAFSCKKCVIFPIPLQVCDPTLFHAMVAFYCGCSNMMLTSVANFGSLKIERFSTPKPPKQRGFSKQKPLWNEKSQRFTVKTLIRAAALKVFSRNFGQNLLSKNLSLLWLLFKCGSYLSAALINVITVYFHFS